MDEVMCVPQLFSFKSGHSQYGPSSIPERQTAAEEKDRYLLFSCIDYIYQVIVLSLSVTFYLQVWVLLPIILVDCFLLSGQLISMVDIAQSEILDKLARWSLTHVVDNSLSSGADHKTFGINHSSVFLAPFCCAKFPSDPHDVRKFCFFLDSRVFLSAFRMKVLVFGPQLTSQYVSHKFMR